ncbi:small GTPase superfamily [Pelagophyceae sp. CCMP2097]|nr:small GTPase superfamily [Pelagophyceae sp. CCMP2097]|mmetsp:Transcript_18576/g.62678  ORF Transcript_18576/g.62678 Transcript_18576/m.62678 type:complete len:195 (+) Transcript_18576:83-667(+)
MRSPGSAGKCREVKVVLLGDTGVGKSSLAQRFVTNSFRAFNESTIGASFMSKMITVDGKPVKMQIWDTAGQEKYHSLAPMYYRGAAAAVLVYDVSEPATFLRLQEWVRELRDQGPEHLVLTLAANKSDLQAKVPTQKARDYAKTIGASFVETSAKEDQNVSELFTDIARHLPPVPQSEGAAFRIDTESPRGPCC